MAIYYLSGQPGAGKTTLAVKLHEFLKTERRNWRKTVFHIDGDHLRTLFPNKDYSKEGRVKNMKLANSLALFLHHHECDVVMSLVAPYAEIRQELYDAVNGNMVEFHIHCSVDRGKLQYHVTDYELPKTDYIDIDTTKDSIDRSFNKLILELNQKTNTW